jgi:hypothetical protein
MENDRKTRLKQPPEQPFALARFSSPPISLICGKNAFYKNRN